MNTLSKLAKSGGRPRPLGGLKLEYHGRRTWNGPVSPLLSASAAELGAVQTLQNVVIGEVVRSLLLLDEGEAEAAHDIVADAQSSLATDADAMYVHALIHRAEGPLLGDPPANVQGYLNSNYWMLRCAHAVAGHGRLRIGTTICADLVPDEHPVWRQLATDSLFADLQDMPMYAQIRQQAFESGGYKCGRYNTVAPPSSASSWDPYAFTLCCKACHSSKNDKGQFAELRSLCELLQQHETMHFASHLEGRARAEEMT